MSVASMTGFGSAAVSAADLTISVEMKSVNNRFLDVVCKLPAAYSSLEPQIVAVMRETLKRGRVEVYVQRKNIRGQSLAVKINRGLVASCRDELKLLLTDGVSQRCLDEVVADFIGRREVMEFVYDEQAGADESPVVLQAVQQAVGELQNMRKREGEALAAELEKHLSELRQLADGIQGAAAQASQLAQQKLRERVSGLLQSQELDEARLYQEIAYLADRADITEELTRLQSHFQQFAATIANGDGGRKLEFLLQEMGREVNTCGSKSQDVALSRMVVEAKTVLEKLREQVLNVE
jgi:uncharacterized protein (TIGR00255 family)